ncbi:hypothetical protein VNI00_010915 [Paramarasmius palmivorus]|uniref:Uncharacterized protein n=1 Tax=Paramarasmius palmivorus TaxID=297713 RepID=A0AAW0CHS3_9AGAR
MANWSYQRLATNVPSPKSWRVTTIFCGTARRRLIVITVGLFFILGSLVAHPTTRGYGKKLYHDTFVDDSVPVDESAPPLSPHDKVIALGPPHYDLIRDYEKNLPQHDLNLPFPEGKTGRYVKFSNQIRFLGWNNCFNEVLMNAHLAYMSKRAYVFQDYVWAPEHYPWPQEQWYGDFPRTPLNAIISGPTAGGLWEAGDDAPRSITEAWFDVVCPQAERRIINTREVKPAIMEAPGPVVFETWRKLLHDAPERCIEIQAASGEEDSFAQTFDLRLWGAKDRITPLWDSFVKSPTSRLLGTSPLVNSAIDRNEYLFHPHGPRPPHPVVRNPWERMMAMHLRRGDYERHCQGLAVLNPGFYSWNLLDFLPDQYTPPPGGWTEENTAIFMPHCWPSPEQIVEKVRKSRADYVAASPQGGVQRTLDIMYLLTNDKSEFLDNLVQALKDDGWHTIRTSRDIVLDQEQTDVSMAIDMDIARRAAVFVGNGFSSFTSNIVHRRLKDGKEPISIRFF